MKKIILILLCLLLSAGFFACSKSDKETTTSKQSTSASTTSVTTTAQSESTTSQNTSIDYIYSGYWYEVGSNNVTAFNFKDDGTAVKSTYRRKTLNGDNANADETANGKFTLKGNTLILNCDGENKTYTLKPETKSMSVLIDDPQGSSTIVLANKSTLDASVARALWFSNN